MDILEKLQGDPKDIVEFIKKNDLKETDAFVEEYKEKKRTIRDEQVGNRLDKPKKDGGSIPVNKIPINFQKKIVTTASGYLFGEPIQITSPDPNEGFKAFRTEWESMRIDSKLLQLCTNVKAYTHGAMLFRITQDSVGETVLKCNVLSPETSKLIPLFDNFGEMQAFCYQIATKNEEDEDVTMFYLYTQTNLTIFEQAKGDPVQLESKVHGFDRIPIIYVSQEQPEWYDVEELIDRYEMTFSKFADANDYFASPFFKAVGKVDNVPTKDDTGSVYMLDIVSTQNGQVVQSDLDVISWDRAPESVKLEFETIKTLINDISNTPDLSFENLRGLGNIAGIALETMFLSSKLKAKYDMIIFQPAIDRIINVMKAGLSALATIPSSELEVQYQMELSSIMPKDLQATVDLLMTANGQKPVMSQQTSVYKNPMLDDSEQEFDTITEEQATDFNESLPIDGL